MSQGIFSYGMAGLMGAAFSLPAVSLLLALILTMGIVTFTRSPNADRRLAKLSDDAAIAVDARYTRERRALGISALAVIAIFIAENIVRGYFLNMADVVSWWRFAIPVFVAFVGVGALLAMIRFGGTARPAQSAVIGARRTWTSFGPRAGLVGAGAAVGALLITTITAGLASSPDSEGRYTYLEIPIPNESIDPLRPWFYGWAYGLPVLACVVALTTVTLVVLHRNAARPFLRAETTGVERTARYGVAAGAVKIATGGMLLTLAGAWRFIASSGSGSQLTVKGDTQQQGTYEVAWRYAEFAAIAGWLAPVLEIAGFVLLLLVIRQLRRVPVSDQATARATQSSDSEVVR